MWEKPDKKILDGAWVRLELLDKEKHTKELYEAAVSDENIFNYFSFGPFLTEESVEKWIDAQTAYGDRHSYAVYSKRLEKYVGSAGFTFIEEAHGKAEIGCVWYHKSAQRSEINGETVYLMLKYLFEELNYVRAQWRCDAENSASKNAACRLGFVYEGLFRNSFFFKEKLRDTCWYSIIDKEWPKVKENFQNSLLKPYSINQGNFTAV